jgi:hypothetical protein
MAMSAGWRIIATPLPSGPVALFRHEVWSPVLVCGADASDLVRRFTADGLDAWGCNPATTPPWDAPAPHGEWRTVVVVDTPDDPAGFLRRVPGRRLLMLATVDRKIVHAAGWRGRGPMFERHVD